MAKVVLLDAGPLGMASHPRPADDILAWLARLLASVPKCSSRKSPIMSFAGNSSVPV